MHDWPLATCLQTEATGRDSSSASITVLTAFPAQIIAYFVHDIQASYRDFLSEDCFYRAQPFVGVAWRACQGPDMYGLVILTHTAILYSRHVQPSSFP